MAEHLPLRAIVVPSNSKTTKLSRTGIKLVEKTGTASAAALASEEINLGIPAANKTEMVCLSSNVLKSSQALFCQDTPTRKTPTASCSALQTPRSKWGEKSKPPSLSSWIAKSTEWNLHQMLYPSSLSCKKINIWWQFVGSIASC